MTKKIICLVLALLMVVPAMVGCSSGSDAVEDLNEDASRFTTTLNMWLITESETVAYVGELICGGANPDKSEKDLTEEQKAAIAALTEEQYDAWEQVYAISEAVNRMTKAKFKTKINLRYVTEEQYYAKVEASFQEHADAIEAAKKAAQEEREAIKNGLITAPTQKEETKGDETVYNQYGVPELKYPTAKDYQVDILFIGDYEKYRNYADNEWLFSIDNQLADSALKLSYYINGMLLDAAKYEGATYAIPNNGPIGEYTYLLVNEELMNRLGYTASDFSSIYDTKCEEFLDLVLGMEGIYPIYSENGSVDMSLVHYWNYDLSEGGSYILKPEEFSIFGSIYADDWERGGKLGYDNLLGNNMYKDRLLRKAKYQDTAGYITQNPNDAAAIRIVKGGWELQEQYAKEGYAVLTMEAPRATDEAVYSSMFAVGGYTEDEDRAMEIITYLNTNVEFRNLIQYGIEGTNYTLHSVEDKETSKEYEYIEYTKENHYHMDVTKTGNLFLAYPVGEANARVWENAKKQNLDALTYPTLGMYFAVGGEDDDYQIDAKSMMIVDVVSDKVGEYLEALFQSGNAVAQIEALFAKTGNASTESMADALIDMVGENLTYVLNGETLTVNKTDLVAALECMKRAELLETEGAQESPYALYLYWRESCGF